MSLWHRGWVHTLVLVAALVLIWQALYWWIGDVALASPAATLAYTAKLFATESFDAQVIETLRAFAIAYALSVVIGLAVGFWLGFDRLSGDTLEPMIVSLYAIPKLTLYPILLLAFGLGLSAKVAFGVLHGVIPIILFTLSAVHNTKPILIKTGRVLNLSRWQMVRWILFPAAVPEIFTGLRVGFALTLIGSLLAEMFASQRGLGYMLMNGIGLHNVELIMAVTLVIVVFAFAVSSLLLYVDQRLHRRA
ncbi:MAG TPA: ABC transporter permease subunit [Candidatus Polarisedimenticolia bacterium]|jgi:NitT/TauT family transport system permease protein|nr:ABC transporter permease subunit [Candidatus Polarisedimenticolia bacterium]